MNRHARRAAAARARKMQRHNHFYSEYIRHLPNVPVDAPYERGQVNHLVFHHDEWCAIYDDKECNCLPHHLPTHRAETVMKNSNSILVAALSYAVTDSWMVFPAPPGFKKKPRIKKARPRRTQLGNDQRPVANQEVLGPLARRQFGFAHRQRERLLGLRSRHDERPRRGWHSRVACA